MRKFREKFAKKCKNFAGNKWENFAKHTEEKLLIMIYNKASFFA